MILARGSILSGQFWRELGIDIVLSIDRFLMNIVANLFSIADAFYGVFATLAGATDVFDESDDFTTIMLKLLVNNPVYAIDNLSKYYSRQKDEVITETDLLKIDKVMDYSLREKGFILKFIQNIFFRNLQK